MTAGRKRTPGSPSAFIAVGEALGVDPRRAEQLERLRRAASFRDVGAFEQHRARDRRSPSRASGCSATAARTECRSSSKYIPRRQPSIGTTSRSAPMPNVVVEQPRQLADRHAVAHRQRIEPDERLEPVHEHRPFDRVAADRIGTIADDHLDAVLLRRHQAVRHRVDVGVDARADVLQIDDEQVDAARASRRSARASRCRASRPARGAARRARGRVSIMFSCTSDRKPCCGPKMAARRACLRAPACGSTRRSAMWRKLAVDRGRVADDAHAAAVQAARRQQTVGSQRHRHAHDYRGGRDLLLIRARW